MLASRVVRGFRNPANLWDNSSRRRAWFTMNQALCISWVSFPREAKKLSRKRFRLPVYGADPLSPRVGGWKVTCWGADLPISLTKEDANEDVGAPRENTHRFLPLGSPTSSSARLGSLAETGRPITQHGLERTNDLAPGRIRKVGKGPYPFRDLPQPTLMAEPGV